MRKAIGGRLALANLAGGEEVAISRAAEAAESEPCTALASIELAKSARESCPRPLRLGLVAPINSRFLATAPSPSSTCTTTGPRS